ncbi:MAG: hypothetical protein R3C11_01150 [Planctomycetaceae bacterium]
MSSSLSTIGEEQHYTFTLGSASLLYLDSFTSSTSLNWSLNGPSGEVIDGQSFTSGNQVLALASGSYTLSVDGAGEATGSYSFLLDTVSNLAAAITPDTAKSGRLDPAGESHVYQFTVTAGDKYSFDSQSWSGSSAARWKLVDPYGNILFDETLSTDVGTLHFHEGGTYSVIIEGDEADSGTPGYTVEVISQGTDTSSPAPLDLSQVVSGNISASLEQDTFTFTLGSGGLYYFDAISDNGPVRWSLTGSTSGSVVTNRTFTTSNANDVADGDAILDLAADTYTLTIDADTGVTGDYAFQLSALSAVATALTSGVGATAAFNSHATQIYSFSATANDRLHLTMGDWTGSLDALWRVVDSTGSVVTSDSLGSGAGNVTLTAGGTYYLLIEGDSAETVLNRELDFEIELEAMTQTAALALGTLVMDSITTAGDTHEYTFTGTAGDTLLLDFDSAATTDHQIRLRGPNGEVLLTTNYSSSNVVTQISSLTLEETGSYQLVVSAENSSTGAYEFQLSVKSDLLLDHDVSGALDGVDAREVFQFSGLAGQTVQLRMDVWGNAADFAKTAARLSTVGAVEDGYNAIDVGLELLNLRDHASKHVILITDEDRDPHNSSETYSTIKSQLEALGITLHSVVNATIDTTNSTEDALGIDGTGTTASAFFADGEGGYSREDSGGVNFTNESGTTEADYIDLTFDITGSTGTVWDLNQLRAGAMWGHPSRPLSHSLKPLWM